MKRLITISLLLRCIVYAYAALPPQFTDQIIADCVTQTNGYISEQARNDKGELSAIIRVPASFTVYDITHTMLPVMASIEKLLYSTQPWKVSSDGTLFSIHIAKDGSGSALYFMFVPKSNALAVYETNTSDQKIPVQDTEYKDFVNIILWSTIMLSDGFIREDYREGDMIRIAIQLPRDSDISFAIKAFKVTYDMFNELYDIVEPWKKDGNLFSSKHMAILENEKKPLVYLTVYCLPEAHVLGLTFHNLELTE